MREGPPLGLHYTSGGSLTKVHSVAAASPENYGSLQFGLGLRVARELAPAGGLALHIDHLHGTELLLQSKTDQESESKIIALSVEAASRFDECGGGGRPSRSLDFSRRAPRRRLRHLREKS